MALSSTAYSQPQMLSLTAADGTRIFLGLHRGLRPKPRLLLIAPGFGQRSETQTMRFMATLLTPSADVAVVDFRGTGRSEGLYQFGAEEAQDLQAALAWARPRYPRVDLMGLSLGGYIAVRASAEGPLMPDHLLVVSAPTRIETVFNSMGWLAHPWVMFWRPPKTQVPGDADPFFRWGSLFARKPSAEDLATKLSVPSHYLVGRRDYLVFQRQTRRIFRVAPEPKSLEEWPGGGHAEHMVLEDPAAFTAWVLRRIDDPPAALAKEH
jgi:pimeloyl-ACP methyl ester carboxylesterase